MRKTLLATTLLATIAATPAAFAHEAGDIIVRAGAVTVTTHESTSGVKTSGLGNLNGKATLNNDTQLGLNFAYMVTDNIGIELLAASPFKHDVHIKNTDVGSMKLGSIKHLPPTLSAVYYPLDSKSAFQPYIGAGINYTWFFDENLSSTAKSGLGANGFKVKNSWGLAAQVGADYMLTDNLMINGQVRYIDIDTDATLNTVAAGRTKVNVDVKPWVYMVGLGYKF
ncbi:MAG: OmpW/AlkL family protein [Thiopseudomonas sp.]